MYPIILSFSQVPILTEQLDHALCKLSWAPSGQLLAVGDVDGVLHIFEAGEVRLEGEWLCLWGLYYVWQLECLITNSVLGFVYCLGFAICSLAIKPLNTAVV